MGSYIKDIRTEGEGVWPNADTSGQGGGGRFLLYFFRTSLMDDPLSCDVSELSAMMNEKSAQRDANTARAGCSKVRTPPARHKQTQTGPIIIHCAAS